MKKTKTKSARNTILELRLKDLRPEARIVVDFASYEDGRQEGYRAGLRAAAEFVSQFDKYVNHDYLLSECILSKFNIMKGKPRRNKRKHVIVGLWKK